LAESAPGVEALRALAAWESRLADPSFSMGSWTPSRTRDDGVIVMGYFTPGQEADAFLRDLGRVGLVRPFDWMAWLKTPRGEELREPAAVATAAPEELANLLTAIVRSERFSEGSLEGAHESGLLLAIARRASGLLSGETAG
jgi:Family of unknown function (DUF6508)